MTSQQLIQAILRLKKETGAAVLAHTYQSPEIIDLADVTGDSFLLSKSAVSLPNQTVILCGVRFMAETVKILSPEKTVILPAPEATCPMAEQIEPARVRAFRKENPDAAVCAYINTTAALKAECDVCVTSSSAVKIVRQLPQKRILFIPDKNLGAYVAKCVPEKELILWDGYCPVHNSLTAADIESVRALHPSATVAMHPECPPEALETADFVGSTSAIIDYAKQRGGNVIIATERGVCEYLNLKNGGGFYQPCPEKLTCRDMKMTTLSELHAALSGTGGIPITLDEELRLRARRSIDKMLAYGG